MDKDLKFHPPSGSPGATLPKEMVNWRHSKLGPRELRIACSKQLANRVLLSR